MVQSAMLGYSPNVLQLAQRGNLQAIAQWLNQSLRPYGLKARVGSSNPTNLRLLIELPFIPDQEVPEGTWQEQLMRFVCHHLWQLNSPIIRGANIAVRLADRPQQILWKQSVRIVTPANRNRSQPHQQMRSRIHKTARRKTRLRFARTLLVGGPAAAAIMVGGFLGYSRAPVAQTDASASSQSGNKNLPTRSDTVRTALETVPVWKHNQVANPQDPTVTLMFAGDVTLSDHFEEIIGQDYQRPFAAMKEYQQADLSMVNLENPLTRATLAMPGKQFNFKADPDAVKVLTTGGVDLVSLANNHTMDFEAEGLKETLTTLDAAGIQYMGAGKDITEARRPKIIDVKGQRIAYLSYWGEEYGAEVNKAGVNSIKEDRIAEDIKAIRDQVDWVIVNFHWGQELAEAPADWQVKLGHFTVDQGADVIVGHHPHVLQGAEIYKGRPIAYSMGNFIFGGNSRTDYETAVMQVSLKDKQMKVEFLPVEVTGYQPKVAEGDRGATILKNITQLSANFQQPMQSPVILDARAPQTPIPTAVPEALAPATLPTSPSLPRINRAPAPLSPDNLIPPPADVPAVDAGVGIPQTTVAPEALNSPATPSTLDEVSTPTPIDPANTDILPGYGELSPPTPTPRSNPADITQPPAAQTEAPVISPNAPQLPAFANPSNSFTNSPSQTPLKGNPQGNQGIPQVNQPTSTDSVDSTALPAAQPSNVSFQIHPKSVVKIAPVAETKQVTEPEKDFATQDVALKAPMMW
ncbi:CapA family protein [Phormidium sp. CLA17]|uniref:CapA family protein n=1 Tax=Leptolyngbya sp. Cla-17 TaxID=2803751 RepID=UPI0014911984|nr:CapA family protein [Leptolyngbya sp. Cla-17]MBM0742258.1 CapA family protein [Leptolyngbya sp. Cla-17]